MNLFDYALPESGEAFTALLETKRVKIVRIVTASVDDRLYCQEEDEWVVVLEGEATLLVNEKRVILKRGDTLFIPSQTPHRILSAVKGTVWLAVHIF